MASKRELLKRIEALERHTKHIESRLSALRSADLLQDLINEQVEKRGRLMVEMLEQLRPKKKAPAKKKPVVKKGKK